MTMSASCCRCAECIDVLEDAYAELAEGRGISRLRSDSFAPTSRKDALYSLKTHGRHLPQARRRRGAHQFRHRHLAQGRRNRARVKVPAAPNQRYVGLVLLFSVENGEPLAIMPDGVMQRMRVGAANGLGVKHLARKDARLSASWAQAGRPALSLWRCATRDIETIRCFSPTKRTARPSPVR